MLPARGASASAEGSSDLLGDPGGRQASYVGAPLAVSDTGYPLIYAGHADAASPRLGRVRMNSSSS
jgi:hypothetical protein